MNLRARAISPALLFSAAAVILLLPGVASAGWGEENWGEMIWGGEPPKVPSIPLLGRVALALLIVALAEGLRLRRRRIGRS